jgi:hypothetical protein
LNKLYYDEKKKKKKTSSGPRTVPWGTPEVTGAGSDAMPEWNCQCLMPGLEWW